MASLQKAFTYLIAGQFQAIGIILAAWWVGDWLNEHHPMAVTWYAVTFPIAVLGVAQTLYIIVRSAFLAEKREEKRAEKRENKSNS